MHSRRQFCLTGCASLLVIAELSTTAKSTPLQPSGLPRLSYRTEAQIPPPLPNFKSSTEFAGFLYKRFDTRIESRGVKFSDDGQKAVVEMINKSMPQIFEVKEESGPIDKSKQYRNVPIQVREVIAIRNLDTLADLAIVAAEREEAIAKKGKLITAAIVQRIRDFVCPMFPFCTA